MSLVPAPQPLGLPPDWEEYILPTPYRAGSPRLVIRRRFLSRELRNYRDLIVALPPSYQNGGGRSYPVIYMHDGQNLFDPATSYAGDWDLVETVRDLAQEAVEAIIVGIPNPGLKRRYEYSPFRNVIHGGGGGDRYLAFVMETVKPYIDRSFRTKPDGANTVMAGSSLGGLITLYAWYRHPDVFGSAGVLSPALWFADGSILRYVEGRIPPSGRLYLDIGTDEGVDAVADARSLRDILIRSGLVPDQTLRYVEEIGGDHDEEAWGRRFRHALPWLLSTEPAGPRPDPL
ncbi:MAG: alpha/beta hydrolase-fold protein [Gemmatimonadota bacterium]